MLSIGGVRIKKWSLLCSLSFYSIIPRYNLTLCSKLITKNMKEVHLFKNNNFLSFYFTFLCWHGDLHYFFVCFHCLISSSTYRFRTRNDNWILNSPLRELVKKLFKYTGWLSVVYKPANTFKSIIHLYKNTQLFFFNLFFPCPLKLHDLFIWNSSTNQSRFFHVAIPKPDKNQIVSSKNRPIKKDTDSRNLNVHWSL